MCANAARGPTIWFARSVSDALVLKSASTVAAPNEATRGGLGTAATASATVAFALNTLGVFTEEEIHWSNWLLGTAVIVVAAAIVFGWFARRAVRRPQAAWRTGLVFAILGLLTIPACWSGLPPVFGGAAVFLGFTAYRSGLSSTARRAGIAALLVGAVAIVLDVEMYATDIASRL